MSKHTITITDSELYNSIAEYCKLNDLKINQFICEMLKKQFTIEQYGDIPFGDFSQKNDIKTESHSIVSIPYVIENKELVMKTDTTSTSNEKYENEIPKEYYSEIKIENVNNTLEVINEKTKISKKRRL